MPAKYVDSLTPMDLEGLRLRAAANLAACCEFPVRRMGQRFLRLDGAWAIDAGSPGPLLNNATIVRPLDPAATASVVESLRSFFAGGSGGSYLVFSQWPQVDLAPFGFEAVLRVTGMVRPPGGGLPPPPAGLEIVEAGDAIGVAAVERAFVEGWPVDDLLPLRPGSVWDDRVLGGDFRLFAGFVDGRPVASAASFVSDGVCGVFFVATVADARGRGYGEAVTWRATLSRPDLPSVLQATPMGHPIYERMGYEAISTWTFWLGARPVVTGG